MCLEIYKFDPAKFTESSFNKTKAKLDLLADIDMLLMVKKAIRDRIRHSIY